MSIEANKRAAVQFFEQIWNQKDESAIDRFLSDETHGNDPDFGTGRESFRKQWRQWVTAFPDLHFEIVDMIGEGNKVLTRWVMTGTLQGEYLGVEPDGRQIRVEGMSLDKIDDGIVVEGCDGWDAYGFRQQLGLAN